MTQISQIFDANTCFLGQFTKPNREIIFSFEFIASSTNNFITHIYNQGNENEKNRSRPLFSGNGCR